MPTLCTKCLIEAFSKTSQIETSLFCHRFFNYFHLCLLQVFPLTKASLLKNRQSEKELECPNLPGSLAFQPLWPSPWPPPMLSRPLWPLPMLYSHFICITESQPLPGYPLHWSSRWPRKCVQMWLTLSPRPPVATVVWAAASVGERCRERNFRNDCRLQVLGIWGFLTTWSHAAP